MIEALLEHGYHTTRDAWMAFWGPHMGPLVWGLCIVGWFLGVLCLAGSAAAERESAAAKAYLTRPSDFSPAKDDAE